MKLLDVSLSVAALLTLVSAQSITNKIILPSALSRNNFKIGNKPVQVSLGEIDSLLSVYEFINKITSATKAGYSVPIRTALKMQPSGPALTFKTDSQGPYPKKPIILTFDQMENADDAVMRVRNAVVSELLRSTLPKQSSG